MGMSCKTPKARQVDKRAGARSRLLARIERGKQRGSSTFKQTTTASARHATPFADFAMDTAGEDLKRYLIVPPVSSSSSSSSILSSSNLVASSEEKKISVRSSEDTKYEQTASTNNKAEKRKMEVDTPTPLPTSFGGAHAEMKDISTPLDGVISMDDFMIQHKPAHEAQKLVKETKQPAPPPSKKAKTPNQKATPLVPVAVGARSSRHTILLHEKYQALGIPQPLFTYGGGSETGWTVSVSFPGLDDAEELQGLKFEEERKFNSKQEAKEALSQKALGVLEELEREGRVKKGGKGKKKKGGGEGEGKVVEKGKEEKEKGPGENYVGKLLEFQRATDSPQPTYTDYQSGQRFSCIITIEEEGKSQQFGSISNLFSSKKAARQDAARHAVEHFKALGTWPTDDTAVGGIRKRKKASPIDPDTVSISPLDNSSSPSPTPIQSTTPTPAPPGTPSYASRVATLAVTLALPTPEWNYTPHPSDPTFHSVCCFFKGAGQHEGPIGEVRNIHGKKKAKEECARLTLEYLTRVKEERLRYGISVMRGVLGSEGVEGVIEGGLGRGGLGEGEGAKKGGEKMVGDVGGKVRLGTGLDGVDERVGDMDVDVGESSEDEVFADAVEG
ncbi:hypothetical protein J4E93_008560 [Alternaria ventricosa]|uniref:uncharacterized protein n=1 Tax=Alternaria ventricosa TaxID=1187951 RepID=UPI0020C25DCE|nr:uncharacterized protein J4E93_008560 [Alternaria ventricosa]KAI4640354.1 hypothetical protein J4E93_008560 [Alternaria ventricosa]